MLNYTYNSNFHYYFDRNHNLNVFFCFNFINYLRLVVKIPSKFLGQNIDFLNSLFDINLFLESEDGVYDKVYIKKFDEVSKVSASLNQEVTTFYGKVNVANLKGSQRISVSINYKYDFYDFITQRLQDDTLNDTIKSALLNLKLIIDQTFAYYEYNTPSIVNQINFESEKINFDRKKIYLSSLYDIYNLNINNEEYVNFLSGSSETKKITYDGEVPITKFIDMREYSLNGEIDKINYEKSILRLLQNSDVILDYKEMCYEQNLYKVVEDLERQKYKIRPSYEVLTTSLTTTVCDNNLFAIENNVKELQGSDILYVANFYNNVNGFLENEFWKEDLTKIPVYLIDIFAKTKIYYLNAVDKYSMNMTWLQLTNEALENLEPGNYLCKINSDKDYINDYLIENYFILVK